jgi:predicted nucleotidyltransferase
MACVTKEVLAEIVETVVREVAPERIILFGSQASGSAAEDSDLDLVIIEDEPFGESRSRKAEISRIRRALSRFRIPKDILVYSSGEADQWKGCTNHILAEAFREGRLLYERYCCPISLPAL